MQVWYVTKDVWDGDNGSYTTVMSMHFSNDGAEKAAAKYKAEDPGTSSYTRGDYTVEGPMTVEA